jgi:hypothetical protein
VKNICDDVSFRDQEGKHVTGECVSERSQEFTISDSQNSIFCPHSVLVYFV